MKRELWEKLLTELGEKQMTKTVFFHVLGEPLLHPELFEAIRFANKMGLGVSLYTNGALLNRKRARELVRTLRRGRVVLSLQDTDATGFQSRSKGTLTWKTYIHRLMAFMLLVEQEEPPFDVQIHCMVDIASIGWNIKTLHKERRRIQKTYDQWARIFKWKEVERMNIFDPAAEYRLGQHISFFVKHAGNWDNQLLSSNLDVVQKASGHCPVMNDTFVVLADGVCSFCCDDFEGRLNLGNANDASLEDIFFGQKSLALRTAEQDGRMLHHRCQECRGILVARDSGKKARIGNLLTDLFVFKHHAARYGLASTFRKVAETASRRLLRS